MVLVIDERTELKSNVIIAHNNITDEWETTEA